VKSGETETADGGLDLERYRSYLTFLVRLSFDPRLKAKLGLSDIVQDTLVLAHENLAQFRGSSPAEFTAWLHAVLANHMENVRRHYYADKRDVRRERPLAEAISRSSDRLQDLFLAAGPSPSSVARHQELRVVLAEALWRLPEAQRETVILFHFEDRPVSEIARELGRTVPAVTGLLRRGRAGLRRELAAAISGNGTQRN